MRSALADCDQQDVRDTAELLTSELVTNALLHAGTDLTGQTISLNNQNFSVIGMLTPKGAGAWGQDQDDLIVLPLNTAMRRICDVMAAVLEARDR